MKRMVPTLVFSAFVITASIAQAQAGGPQVGNAFTPPQNQVSFTYTCDVNHNLVYLTSTGSIFVLPNWPSCAF